MCKIIVQIIWRGDITGFLIVISFQLNSTDIFTIPINSDVVIFKCIYYMVSILLQTSFAQKSLTTIFIVVGCAR